MIYNLEEWKVRLCARIHIHASKALSQADAVIVIVIAKAKLLFTMYIVKQ